MSSERGFVKKAVAWKLFWFFGLDRFAALGYEGQRQVNIGMLRR